MVVALQRGQALQNILSSFRSHRLHPLPSQGKEEAGGGGFGTKEGSDGAEDHENVSSRFSDLYSQNLGVLQLFESVTFAATKEAPYLFCMEVDSI